MTPGAFDAIQSTRLTECPTSFITDESNWILDELNTAQMAHAAFGVSKYGANLDRWPAWWFDAVAAFWYAKSEADRIEMT